MCLLTGEIVVLFHVLSDVDTETFYRMACRGTHTTHGGGGGGERLILPSMSHSNNSRRSKNICIFFRNHPSRPYSQGVFAFHNTELLLYTFMQGKGCYFFLITLHLSSRFYSLFTEKQVKKELEAFQKGNSTSSP